MRVAWYLALWCVVLSCRDATQITVRVHGEGFECRSADLTFGQSVVISVPAVPSEYSIEGAAIGQSEDCETGSDAADDKVELGTVVLLPTGNPDGPVEVLVIGAIEENNVGPTNDECLALYNASLAGTGSGGAPSVAQALCIVARRSLGFIQQTKLEVDVKLSTECAGVFCEGSETCSPGKGCVDATVPCEEDGTCGPLGSGGAGLGGAGGAGQGGAGGGGAGGSGGGPVGPWVQLDVPSGTPHDVVGFLDGTDWVLWVAADDTLIRYVDGVYDLHRTAFVPRSFLAVTARGAPPNAGPEIAAAGVNGIWMEPETAFTDPGAITSVMSSDASVKLAWRESEDAPDWSVDTGQTCVLSLDGASLMDGPSCAPAVLAIGPPPDLVFAVTKSAMYPDGGASLGESLARSVWSPGGSAAGYEVFILNAMGRVSHVEVQEDLFSLQDNNVPTVPGIVRGLSGVREPGDPVTLFAVGSTEDDSGWLGMSTLPAAPFDPVIPVEWIDVVPPTPSPLEAIWIGSDHQGDAVVVVAGPGGVHWAKLAEVASP